MNPEAQVIPLQPFRSLHVFIYLRWEEDNTHGSDSLQKLGLSCYVGLRIEPRSPGFFSIYLFIYFETRFLCVTVLAAPGLTL